jgi:hypothetical protein
MGDRFSEVERDHALRVVRRATLGGAGAALGLTGVFSVAAAITFSGKATAGAPAVATPPSVPVEAAPVQRPPPAAKVIQRIVHVAAAASIASSGSPGAVRYGSVPSAPRQAPVPAGGSPPAAVAPPAAAPLPPPPPPPPPPCHSTPTHPC